MEKSNPGRKKELFELLDQRNKNPSDKERIDKIITEQFEKKMAVMITNSVGFSKRTVEHGIIQFLAVLNKVNDKLKPIIKNNKGIILSEWADNFVLAFEFPEDAVSAGIKINKFLKEYNNNVPDEESFWICVGIGYGSVLYVGDDIFGHEVNLASKLGEDLAKKREILITENVYLFLKEKSNFVMEEVEEINISKISFKYYKIIY